MKGCGCPDYFTRCEHAGGLLIAMITPEDIAAEYRCRTGEQPTDKCAACGRRMNAIGKCVIVGPGVIDEAGPNCACLCEVVHPTDPRHQYPDTRSVRSESVEFHWAKAQERLAQAALRYPADEMGAHS